MVGELSHAYRTVLKSGCHSTPKTSCRFCSRIKIQNPGESPVRVMMPYQSRIQDGMKFECSTAIQLPLFVTAAALAVLVHALDS